MINIFGPGNGLPKHFWLTPALSGVTLILLGVLIFKVPKLLEYVIATMFIIAGGSLLGVAWRLRSRVRYRRLNEHWRADDDRF